MSTLSTRYEIKQVPLGFGREAYVVSLDGQKLATKDSEFDAQVAAVMHELECENGRL